MSAFQLPCNFLLLALLVTSLFGCGGNSNSHNHDNSDQTSQQASKQSQKVRRFVDDLKTWQEDIELSPEKAPFEGVGEAASSTATKELTELVQVMAIAGQQATLVALPELYLKAACDRLDPISGFICHRMVADKTLEELCNSALNLKLMGKPVCVWLDAIPWPIDPSGAFKGNSLYNRFALLNGRANLLGYDATTDISLNIQLTESGFNEDEVFFSVSGTAQQGDTQLTVTNGTFTYYFESLDGNSFQTPHSMDFQLEVRIEDLAETENSVAFEGDTSGTVTLAEQKPFRELIGLDKLAVAINAEGEFISDQNKRYPANLVINNHQAIDFELTLQVQTNDLNNTAQVSYDSSQSFTIAWDNKAYEVIRNNQETAKVTVSNQEQVTMKLDYEQTSDTVGEIQIDGQTYGQVSLLNGSLLITLNDGTELVL